MPRKPVAMNSAMAERLAGIRMNLQTVVLLAMVVIAMIALAPQAQVWFEQQQQIAELRAQVDASKRTLAQMATERKRWNDPVYIRSQARDRLYYVLPGEVSYLVMGADGISSSDQSGTVGAQLAQQRASATISNSITRAKRNWVNSLMQSVVRAGIDEPSSAGASTSVGK
jgi:cell division protein FtsB